MSDSGFGELFTALWVWNEGKKCRINEQDLNKHMDELEQLKRAERAEAKRKLSETTQKVSNATDEVTIVKERLANALEKARQT
jgi:hypothetical protein